MNGIWVSGDIPRRDGRKPSSGLKTAHPAADDAGVVGGKTDIAAPRRNTPVSLGLQSRRVPRSISTCAHFDE